MDDLTRRVYKEDLFAEMETRGSPAWQSLVKVLKRNITKAAQSGEPGPVFDLFERMLRLEMDYQQHVKKLIAKHGRPPNLPQEQESTTESTTEPEKAERFLID